jgi:hypothetical protein
VCETCFGLSVINIIFLRQTVFCVVRGIGNMAKRKSNETFNPVSSWREETVVDGLTLWEMNRPVWKTVEENEEEPAIIELPNSNMPEFKVNNLNLFQ